jgi:L-threonylcarbamoyladenylate synthase
MDNIKKLASNIAADLAAGKTLLYPTETIWGLGCDAHNEKAIEKIYQLKARPTEKKFILLVDSFDMLKTYVREIPQKAARLIDHYEKPLTVIYDINETAGLPPMLINEDNTVAIRLTRDPFCAALVKELGRPIVSTSANLSGEAFPTCFAEIHSQLKSGVDVVANYRQDDKAQYPPSAIVRICDGQDLIFIRK